MKKQSYANAASSPPTTTSPVADNKKQTPRGKGNSGSNKTGKPNKNANQDFNRAVRELELEKRSYQTPKQQSKDLFLRFAHHI
jgi:hypothetical protein